MKNLGILFVFGLILTMAGFLAGFGSGVSKTEKVCLKSETKVVVTYDGKYAYTSVCTSEIEFIDRTGE